MATLFPFAAGVAISVPMEHLLGFKCMVLPVVVILWMLICIQKAARQHAADKVLSSAQSPVAAAEAEAEEKAEDAADVAAIEYNKSAGMAESVPAGIPGEGRSGGARAMAVFEMDNPKL
jgi:hypothetical protein